MSFPTPTPTPRSSAASTPKTETLDARVIFLGNAGVGKTSIIGAMCGKRFSELVGRPQSDYEIVTLDNPDPAAPTKRFVFVDTAGQEEFRSLTSSYYRNADIQLIVFDIADLDSFHDLGEHLNDASRYCSASAVRILVANKTDLELERAMRNEDIAEFADRNDMDVVHFSAKTGMGREELYQTMERHLGQTVWKSGDQSFIQLSKLKQPKPKRRCDV